MSNETTNNGNSWPADQMNLTHYLDGTLVPTAAPVSGSGTFDSQGLTNNPPGGGTGSTINGGAATTQAPGATTPVATQDPSAINNQPQPSVAPPGGPGLASMQD